jgi:lipoprotein-anchoring transpeptidase ErfK/SrfK
VDDSDSEQPIAGTGKRRVLAAVAALVPLVPIVAGILMTSSSVPARAAGGLTFIPSALSKFNPSVPLQSTALPPGSGALVALLKHPTTLRTAPGGRPLARLPNRTEFGSPEALWVLERRGAWLGVVSSLAGNGRIGWIPQSTTALSRVSWELKVSLSARRLTVLEGGRVLQHFTVAIGRPDAPTPTGRFAVTDRLSTGDSSGPYGCCILALSAHSPHAIQGWSGGDRIAIHSTPDTSSIGQAVSHGCLRVTLPQGRWMLAHVPLGTPTLISS